MSTRDDPRSISGMQESARQATFRSWGLALFASILLVIFGFIVLSLDVGELWVLAVLLGVAFILTGVVQIARAFSEDESRWLWVAGGSLAILAGAVALAYPGETLLTLSLLLAWVLVVVGLIDILMALLNTKQHGWWVGLVGGIIEIGLGAWAAGEPDRSVLVLTIIVGVFAIVRGVVGIVVALQLRDSGGGPTRLRPA